MGRSVHTVHPCQFLQKVVHDEVESDADNPAWAPGGQPVSCRLWSDPDTMPRICGMPDVGLRAVPGVGVPDAR